MRLATVLGVAALTAACNAILGLDAYEIDEETAAADAAPIACGLDVPGSSPCDGGFEPPPDIDCPPLTERCDGRCVDVDIDERHCGRCGKRCGEGMTCSAGECVCPEGLTACAASCEDLQRSTRACGRCGNSCDPGEHCVDGRCSPCPDGSERCAGRCPECPANTVAHCLDGRVACCGDDEQPCDRPGELFGCYPRGTDCTTATLCDGERNACDAGEAPHCGSGGGFYCCGGERTTFCDVASAAEGCWDTDTDCSTIRRCGGRWWACDHGQTPWCGSGGNFYCCSGDYSTFCDPSFGNEGCWTTGTDCSTIRQCGGQWRACDPGETPHCSAAGEFKCCDAERPLFCDVAAGAACFRSTTDCASVVDCPGRGLVGCSAGHRFDCGAGTCVPN